jgi:hypothetical protein
VVAQEAKRLGLPDVLLLNRSRFPVETAVMSAMQWAEFRMKKPGIRPSIELLSQGISQDPAEMIMPATMTSGMPAGYTMGPRTGGTMFF